MKQSALRIALLVTLALLAALLAASCAAEPWRRQEGPTLPETLRIGGKFSAVVERSAAGSYERRLLERAEATPPNCKIQGAWYRNACRDGRWWIGAPDGIRVAHTVTGSAVRYYLSRLEDMRAGRHRPFRPPAQTARLVYRAEVARESATLPDGQHLSETWVVRLDLSWSMTCGNLCGLGFERSRTVVFSSSGEVLQTIGDGDPSFWIS